MHKISSELLYVFAILLLGFGVNLMSIADCGMSMIVCPAYIISQKYNHLTYGQAEYLVAGFLFVIFCIILRKFRLAYLSSFITGFLYATTAFKIHITNISSNYIFFGNTYDLFLFGNDDICFSSSYVL